MNRPFFYFVFFILCVNNRNQRKNVNPLKCKLQVLSRMLSSHVADLISCAGLYDLQDRFEEAQEKAFAELDYEECTEDQCIMLIQEFLQVENVFYLEVIGEGKIIQMSISWRTLDQNQKETDVCFDCGTFELNGKIKVLIQNLINN